MATINTICHAIKIIIRLTETLRTSLLTLPNNIYITQDFFRCGHLFIGKPQYISDKRVFEKMRSLTKPTISKTVVESRKPSEQKGTLPEQIGPMTSQS